MSSFFTGLITTTSRKLDREQQAEHFLEVSLSGKYMLRDLLGFVV